jgi:23S rRNA (uracil1939-C5)-methyltransferase
MGIITGMTDIELDLTTWVYGGDAMGRQADGRAVFVPFGMPGERVRARLIEDKRNFARALLLEVLKPAAERIQPRCPHFAVCGGCHYQHMDYAEQLKVKAAIVREQLVRLGGMPNPPMRPIVGSPQEWNYRNTVQFHQDRQGRLGFQAADGRGVVAVRECHLPEPDLNQLWPQLDLDFVPGLERISLRVGADGDFLMALEGEELASPELSVEELPVSVVQLSEEGATVLAGDEAVYLEVLGRSFRVSAGSFFQVNTAMAAQMVEHVLALLDPQLGQIALDLYCGVGLFSAFLAARVAELIAVEVAPSACADFVVNLDEFENIALYEGLAEQILPALQRKVDIAVVDPPRAGLERAALDALIALQPATLVYVSCDPATLARDLKRLLASGYTVEQVTPFDLFPQTYHVETIVLLRRA